MNARIVVFSTGSAWLYVGRTIYSFDRLSLAVSYAELNGYTFTVEDA